MAGTAPAGQSAAPARHAPCRAHRARQDRTISLPAPYAAARITAFLSEHLCWSAFWDKRDGVWRVSEHDPDSALYAESPDADTVIAYMAAHSGPARLADSGCYATPGMSILPEPPS
jgi:hypothetical protein